MLTTTTDTDTECQEILQRFADGSLPETEARQLIADALHRSDIVKTVAREKPNASVQMCHDLISEMAELLYTKVMQDTPGGFDLDLGLGSSTVGWARQLLRFARGTMLRNIATRTLAKMELVDPIRQPQGDEGSGGPSHAYIVFHTTPAKTSDTLSVRTEQTMQDAADWLHSKTRHLRDSSRLEAQSASIRHAYTIPALVRPRLAEHRRRSVRRVPIWCSDTCVLSQ